MQFKRATDVDLTDPHLIFANHTFRELTGYKDDELIGQNCRFRQRPKTDPAPIAAMRKAIANEDVVIVETLNYRKDGSTFWNVLHLGPIFDEAGMFAVVSGIVNVTR